MRQHRRTVAPRDASDAAAAEAVAGYLPGARRAVAYLLVGLVMLSVATMSFSGLFGFARQTLGWSQWHAALFPVALDVAALACAFLALDSLARNDSAAMLRTLTAAFVALSAFVNLRHAEVSHNVAEVVFFPAMSILSYLLIDAVMRKSRRDTRRDRAGRPTREALEPLPRFGLAAALTHPRRAYRATTDALARRIPEVPAPRAGAEAVAIDAAEFEGVSQATAIRAAIAAVGDSDPGRVVAYLEQAGRAVARQRVCDVIRRDREAGRPALTLAGRADEADEHAS